jgi:hypothetical protein
MAPQLRGRLDAPGQLQKAFGYQLERPRLDGMGDRGAAELRHRGGNDDRLALLISAVQKRGDALRGGIPLIEGE